MLDNSNRMLVLVMMLFVMMQFKPVAGLLAAGFFKHRIVDCNVVL